jgi:hypothetical protein
MVLIYIHYISHCLFSFCNAGLLRVTVKYLSPLLPDRKFLVSDTEGGYPDMFFLVFLSSFRKTP